MLICCLFVFGIDTTFEFVILVLSIIAIMFGIVHRFFATVFLFFKRCDHVLKIIRRKQFMRDALTTEGTGLSVFFDKALT